MRPIVALLLCLWLPAQAGQTPQCGTVPSRLDPACQPLGLDGVVIRKTIIDPQLEATQYQSTLYDSPNGASGSLLSAVIDGSLLFQLVAAPDSKAALQSLTVLAPGNKSPQYAWVRNGPGDLAPDFALQNTLVSGEVSFLFANGLQPGQSSRWIIDLNAGPAFAPVGLGIATDVLGGASLAQPLLAAVPEPASAALLLAGLIAIARRRRAD